ncbi:MAG: glucose 1-dehydrogenase [Burkholderiales bacterium]|jgi:NAD(P)-dependent dehydrogenase (short-subunit alcohol dehydrogenase family)
MRLKDKVALITGAASGMGESAAQVFAREGAKVVVADILEDEGNKVVSGIVQSGGEAFFIKLDVTSEEQWQSAVDATLSRFGKLDILINNAGLSGAVPDRLDVAYFDKLMAVNARGNFLGMKYVIPPMQNAGGGSIVNMSSMSGIVGQEFVHMGYNGAKGAIRLMTKSAAVQFGKDGIRVNSVHPGLMPPMRTSATSADPKLREKVIETIPLRRAGRVEEAAYALLFLASDEASYITGAELAVDGGAVAA